jgi:anti-sigma-K factor RskA
LIALENLVVDLRISDQEHKMYRELLGAYALDAVSRDEEFAISAHLEECDSCRAEVARLRSVVNILPLSVEEVEPPARLRSSILAAIEQEPNVRTSPAAAPTPAAPPPVVDLSERRSRRQWLPWAAAAALLVVSLGLLGWNLSLRDSDEPETRTIALAAASGEITASGEATYLEEDGVLLLSVEDMPELGPNQVYQVWLIDEGVPVSAGVMQPVETDFAVSANPDDYDVVAITAEQGPVGVAAPTTEPVLTGALQTA